MPIEFPLDCDNYLCSVLSVLVLLSRICAVSVEAHELSRREMLRTIDECERVQ